MKKQRVVIADDHVIFQQGLRLVLEFESQIGFEVVGVAASGRELVALVKEVHPKIVFLDLNMPDMDGFDTLKYLKNTNGNDLKIIVLTMYDDAKIVKMALKEGIDAYILKKYGKEEIIKAVAEVLDNKTYFGKGVDLNNDQLLPPNKYQDRFVSKHKLTKRELQILQLISQALSNKQIAKKLFISDQTVSVHRKNIMKKLQVNNTAGLIKVAHDYKLIHY